MQVEATREGYYNHRRVYEGQRFEIFKEDDFSKTWMKRLDGSQAPQQEQAAPPAKTVEVPKSEEPESEDVI